MQGKEKVWLQIKIKFLGDTIDPNPFKSLIGERNVKGIGRDVTETQVTSQQPTYHPHCRKTWRNWSWRHRRPSDVTTAHLPSALQRNFEGVGGDVIEVQVTSQQPTYHPHCRGTLKELGVTS